MPSAVAARNVASAPPASPPEDAATAYARAVVAGTVPACRWVRLACQRHLEDLEHGHARGLWWDADGVEDERLYFEGLQHSKGEWAGQPIRLEPFQLFINGSLFCWKRLDGTRRFRMGYVELPRKNGKSTQAAGIGIRLAFDDDEPGADVFAAATKRDQAKIVWSEARRMVLRSSRIRERVAVLTANLNDPATASKFEPLGADADNLDGLNVHGAIVDELHAHKTRAIWDVLETATGARRQPLILAITTAGFNRDSVCWEQHDYALKVLEGTAPDDAFFAYIATIDPEDDPFDAANWAKANPNLGVSAKLDDLQRLAKRAQQSPGARNAFLRLRLNVWTRQQERWLDLAQWQACTATVSDVELAGVPCVAGLDLGQTDDFSTFVRVFRFPDGRTVLRVRYWIPEAALLKYPDRPYAEWRARVDFHVHDGDTVSYKTIGREILELCRASGVRSLGYDKRFAEEMAQMLTDEGIECVAVNQGFGLSHGLQEIQRLLADGLLVHGGDLVLTWMADNAVAKYGPEGQIKLMKPRGSGERPKKIDGLIALAEALDPAVMGTLKGPTVVPRVWVA